jgi:hypothetical protein
MLGPGLHLEALQGLSHRGEQRFAFLCSALHDEPLAVLEERQRELEQRPELAASRGCGFQALLDLVVLAAGSSPISIRPVEVSSFLSDLPVMRSEDVFAGARRARSALRSRPSGPRYAQPPPCPVGSCGRATQGFRS